jgi:membrane protease YdiL (CAAX protease family)
MTDQSNPSSLFWKALGRFCLQLLLAQVFRAGLAILFQDLLNIPSLFSGALSLALSVGVVLAFTHPGMKALGLDFSDSSKKTRILYFVFGILWLGMGFAIYFIDPSLLMQNIYGVLIVPLLEELLFRGLGWHQISSSIAQKNNDLITWIAISVLFGLWHIGYADVVLYHAEKTVSMNALPTVLLWKVLIGGFIGGVAGLARWKTKKLPAGIYIHALFNFFGR